MPTCGFCKKEVIFDEKEQPNTVKSLKFHPEKITRFKVFTCPHCDAVLGIGGPY